MSRRQRKEEEEEKREPLTTIRLDIHDFCFMVLLGMTGMTKRVSQIGGEP